MEVLITDVLLDGKTVDVLITGNRFAAIGALKDREATRRIDGSGKAILPSLMNGHTHAAMTLLRGYADDMPLETWLQKHIWPVEAKLTQEDIYWGTKYACLEMIKTGTTFFADMYWHLPGTVRAVEEMGLRAALSGAFFDFNDPDRAREGKAQVEKLRLASSGYSDRLQFILGPHALYTVSRESLLWARDYAREHGLLIHMHLAETRTEVENCIKEHGRPPVEYLHELGLLSSQLIAAHCVWLTDKEADLLAAHDVQVVHNPVSNMKLASGPFPYDMLARKGVNIGLGTDGCASNNNLDMFEEMKIAALLAKLESGDPTTLGAPAAFDMATANGAAMYGIECGKIEEGMLADCMLVDLHHPQLVPNHNLLSNLVYSASGDCVDTVVCNGRVLMQNRVVPGEQEIRAGFLSRVEGLLHR